MPTAAINLLQAQKNVAKDGGGGWGGEEEVDMELAGQDGQEEEPSTEKGSSRRHTDVGVAANNAENCVVPPHPPHPTPPSSGPSKMDVRDSLLEAGFVDLLNG